MFGIGTAELMIIALIALVVLGPERLPRAARFAGVWIRRARGQWYSVKAEFERELSAEDLKRSVQDAQRSIADVGTRLRDAGTRVREGVDEARRDTESLVGTARLDTTAPAAPLPEGAIAADPTTPPATPDASSPPQDTGDDPAR